MTQEKFCRLLKAMIVDETKAPGEYHTLYDAGKGVASRGDLRLISSNAGDEGTHRKRLEGIARRVC